MNDEIPPTDTAGDADTDASASASVPRIAHADLTHDHLPHPRAPFDDVVRFAYTFDAYGRLGMRMCGEIANRALRQYLELAELPSWLTHDMDRLRGCLFFEVRRCILHEREPDTRTLVYVHALVRAIGDAIDARAAGPREAADGAR